MTKDRLTRRFLTRDPDALPDVQLLELLLRFSAEDAAGLAARLMEQYPSIAALIEADREGDVCGTVCDPDCFCSESDVFSEGFFFRSGAVFVFPEETCGEGFAAVGRSD